MQQSFDRYEVVQFWVAAGSGSWFRKNEAFDDRFREKFAAAHEAAARGELDDWSADGDGALALLILLDQYPRNSFRGSPRMFATDDQALDVAKEAIASGFDVTAEPSLRLFFTRHSFIRSASKIRIAHCDSMLSLALTRRAMRTSITASLRDSVASRTATRCSDARLRRRNGSFSMRAALPVNALLRTL